MALKPHYVASKWYCFGFAKLESVDLKWHCFGFVNLKCGLQSFLVGFKATLCGFAKPQGADSTPGMVCYP